MNKIILIIFILASSLFADKMQVIESLSDIPKNKNVILIFSMEFCPYCIRQEKSILKRIKPKFSNIAYLKVMEETKVFQELIRTGNFGEVEYFPTTYILKIDTDNTIDVKYPFKGLQKSSHIIEILNDKDIMSD